MKHGSEEQENQIVRGMTMKDRRVDDVLSFTFNHLTKVLNGEVVDHDGFISKTAIMAENECKRFARECAGRDSRGEAEKEFCGASGD